MPARPPNSRAHISYSRPRDGDRIGVGHIAAGRLSAQVIRDLDPPRNADAYPCGPTVFMTDMTSALGACGLAPARIRTETFGALSAITPGIVPQWQGPAPARPPSRPEPGPTVSFARSGLTAPWHPGYGTPPELAGACDVPTRRSCRTGVCHACETAVLSGRVACAPEPIEAPAESNALICCSQPAGDHGGPRPGPLTPPWHAARPGRRVGWTL
ncbi:hypothetical protein [Streptomyces sp. NPDC051636]|uniref:hypothetical protein n=1 Tax=Streptomyces sp. NPDC051636 TaxID=3365663 RepID=UPI0037B9F4C5